MSTMNVIRGSAWNAAGLILPLAAGLYAVPQIIKLLGDHAAGVLMLIWGLIGYFSLFDFGLGRAVTQRMATHFANQSPQDAADAGITAIAMLVCIGGLSGLVMYVTEPYFTSHWADSASMSSEELARALIYVAWTLPLVVLTAGLRGVLEAESRFAASNLVRLPLGVWTFISPVFAAKTGASFSEIILVLMLGRILASIAYAILTIKPLRSGRVKKAEVNFLAKFGGWMTVSNLVSPLMTQLDRYMIAFLLTAAAVTYFVTPYEIVMRVQLIAAAVTAAYLPQFVAMHANDPGSFNTVFRQANRLVLLPTILAAAFLYLFAAEFISIWISPDFAAQSASLMKILCIGIIFNSQALVPYTLLQAVARPKLIALNHLIELPLYVALLWFATTKYGLVGAAVASTVRVIGDYFLLQWQSLRIPALAQHRLFAYPTLHLLVIVVLLLMVDQLSNGITVKLIFFISLCGWTVHSIWQQIRSRGSIGKSVEIQHV